MSIHEAREQISYWLWKLEHDDTLTDAQVTEGRRLVSVLNDAWQSHAHRILQVEIRANMPEAP